MMTFFQHARLLLAARALTLASMRVAMASLELAIVVEAPLNVRAQANHRLREVSASTKAVLEGNNDGGDN